MIYHSNWSYPQILTIQFFKVGRKSKSNGQRKLERVRAKYITHTNKNEYFQVRNSTLVKCKKKVKFCHVNILMTSA